MLCYSQVSCKISQRADKLNGPVNGGHEKKTTALSVWIEKTAKR